ncbi:hypothetical protein ACCO45_003448 [Purpureocillium lilacinum]|uniref:Uncharacterized protein n=1 Tax=Purpureocillium lilacinum TaxID=33203 RepID=A0ACC4E2R8_PURLI
MKSGLATAAVRAAPRALTRARLGTSSTSFAAAAATPAVGLARRNGEVRFASGAAPAGDLKKTPLYDLHLAHGAKMVPLRATACPHMVQHIFKGKDAAAFLERVTPSGWATQANMASKLTTFLWPGTGGIVDDSVITRIGEDEYYVVTNGACFEKDTKYLDEELGKFGGSVEWTRLDGSGLVALQGPQAAEVLKEVLASDVNLDGLYFGNAVWADLKLADGSKTHPVLISRGGYTGEDGFEISFNGKLYPALETTTPAVEALLKAAGPERLQLAGLGARDSLRLEAGMCLYGNDLDDTTTPVEAGLSWVIPKERRAAGGFHGAEVIIPQLTPKSKGGAGVERRRDGQTVGKITSGVPSPTLGKNIAMGYVKDGLHKAGTELDVVVRGRKRKGVVTKMPFVQTRYHKSDA